MLKHFIQWCVILFAVHPVYTMQYMSKTSVRRCVSLPSMQNALKNTCSVRNLSMQSSHEKEKSVDGKFKKMFKNPKVTFGLGVLVGVGAMTGVVLYHVADAIMVVSKLKKQQ